jgi:hypothetical protein
VTPQSLLVLLPTPSLVGILTNMKRGPKAELLLDEQFRLSETLVAELVIWKVPAPLAGSAHSFKYRLALVHEKVCVLRYDNEAGKGDHKHIRERETAYRFVDLAQLQTDFWSDVDEWSRKT